MLGSMIEKIRKDKNIKKVELSKRTKINIGHITHIEKGERNPSQSALKDLCKALDIPYQQLAYTYDKKIDDDQLRLNMISTVPYNTVPLIRNIDDMVVCPTSIPNASLAFVPEYTCLL